MTPVDVLLRALRDFLRDELRPHLSGYSAYQNRIAVNLLALLEREERHGAALHALDAQRLEQLGFERGAGLARLARALRDGACDDTPALRGYLRERTLLRLAIDNPGYSGLAQARERWPALARAAEARLAAGSGQAAGSDRGSSSARDSSSARVSSSGHVSSSDHNSSSGHGGHGSSASRDSGADSD